MAKGKSTWKYNKLLTARRNYFAFGTSDRNNPMGIDFTSNAYHGYRGNADATAGFVKSANANGAGIDTNNLPGSLGGGAIKGPNIFQNAGSDIKGFFTNPGAALSSPTMGITSMLGAAAGAVGQIGGQLLSNGLESKAGGIVSGVGDALGAVPIVGGFAKGALNLIGGGVNALFGSKLNQENIAAVEGATARANSAMSTAADFDTLSSTMGSTADVANFSDKFIGRDGVFSSKAKKKAAALREEARVANERQALALLSNAEDIEADTLRNLEANYAAFGGPMDFGGGAIDYDFMNQYLGIKELAALGKDPSLGSLHNSFADGGGIHIKKANRGKFTEYCGGKVTSECIARGKRSSSPAVRKRATFAANARKWKHAFGGDLLTHGANFDTGVTIVGNGGTHEENPYEGVPMGVDNEGTPNLVEQGEVIFKDYVFSNRLTVPKTVRNKYKLRGVKPLTFAAAAKQLSKEAGERPNDPISQNGLNALMSRLASEQEALKAEEESRKFAKGGRLFADGGERQRNTYGYVKGYNSGWFGDDGKYTQEYLNKVNNMTPEQLAKAFNAQYAFYNDPANKGTDRWKAIDKFYASNPSFKTADITLTPEEVAWARRGAQDYKPGFMHQFFMDAEIEDTPERLTANRYWLRGKNGPTPLEVTPWEGLNEQGQTFAEAYPNMRFYGKQERPYDEATNTTFTDYYYDPLEEEVAEEAPDVTSPEYKKLPTWMRYAPAVGLGLGVLTDALGWTNKPDYGNADAILEATRGAGNYLPVEAGPIGNYLGYTPFDREFYINQMNAQSGATRRAIMQNAGLNRGAGMAALLASDYNTQGQLGQLARQAEEYNLAQRQQVEEFNRATNMFNVEKALQADMANQSAQASMRDFNLRGTMAAAEMREKARLASEAAKSANLSGFINAIGDIGRENMAWNWRNFGLSTGSFGNVGDAQADLLTHTGRKKPKEKAKGGKIKRRKKGLTY